MPILTSIKPKSYHDSVRLMRVSEVLSGLSQVKQAIAAMSTDANKRVLAEVGLLTDDVRRAGANDLVLVIEADSETAGRAAIDEAERILAEGDRPAAAGVAAAAPRTLEQARRALADANLMLISTPGAYAALEAAKALQAGMHVFLFSDNVTPEEELALKRLAISRGLLMMGPGCGTAVINGVALAFANVLKRGPVGVVGASGTGLQELTSLVDRGGAGISQAIGVGGRDLSEAIGGIMMLQGIAMLAADPATEVIALISKPPAALVARKILDAARASGKPVVTNFLGSKRSGSEDGVEFATTIEEAAEAVLRQVDILRSSSSGIDEGRRTKDGGAVSRLLEQAEGERGRLRPGQRYLRGLFSGGSLCDEAMGILSQALGGVYSNIPLAPQWALEDAWRSKAHSCVDLGEEEFTRGRPHPMIDPRLRQERLLKEAEDPEVAVILLVVVIGYGAHDDPAGALGETIRVARASAVTAGRYLSVVAHVCGTLQDPQGLEQQEQTLREAGALVLPTNAQAARVAAAIASVRD
jgi:FdrA protein